LPPRLEPGDGRGRQRRALAEEPAQGQIEFALSQPVQVQLGQKVADFRGATWGRDARPIQLRFANSRG